MSCAADDRVYLYPPPSTPTASDDEAPLPLPQASSVRVAVAPRPLEVLVVDDDTGSGELLALAIRSFGHRCRTAENGEDALRAVAEKQPDIVISDWAMPVMNGVELCRQMRAAGNDARYTYFVLLSGFCDDEHVLAGMEAGADDFYDKPVDLGKLEASLLSGARVVDLHRMRLQAARRRREEQEVLSRAKLR